MDNPWGMFLCGDMGMHLRRATRTREGVPPLDEATSSRYFLEPAPMPPPQPQSSLDESDDHDTGPDRTVSSDPTSESTPTPYAHGHGQDDAEDGPDQSGDEASSSTHYVRMMRGEPRGHEGVVDVYVNEDEEAVLPGDPPLAIEFAMGTIPSFVDPGVEAMLAECQRELADQDWGALTVPPRNPPSPESSENSEEEEEEPRPRRRLILSRPAHRELGPHPYDPDELILPGRGQTTRPLEQFRGEQPLQQPQRIPEVISSPINIQMLHDSLPGPSVGGVPAFANWGNTPT